MNLVRYIKQDWKLYCEHQEYFKKLCLYSNIFTKFQLQNYSVTFPYCEGKKIFTYRISAHSLTIETGRYNGTLRKDRFCQFCPSLVEDEMHFLLRCAKYQNIRTSYNSLFQKEEGTNDADLLRVILNPESLSATKQICNFIKDAEKINKCPTKVILNLR
jgi:hypothetical protein